MAEAGETVQTETDTAGKPPRKSLVGLLIDQLQSIISSGVLERTTDASSGSKETVRDIRGQLERLELLVDSITEEQMQQQHEKPDVAAITPQQEHSLINVTRICRNELRSWEETNAVDDEGSKLSTTMDTGRIWDAFDAFEWAFGLHDDQHRSASDAFTITPESMMGVERFVPDPPGTRPEVSSRNHCCASPHH